MPSLQEQSRRHVHRCDGEGRAGPQRMGRRHVCIGDYNNDGWNDLFITYFGQNALYRNNGNGTFTDVTEKTGYSVNRRESMELGLRILDYDRDGQLDLFVANYIDFDSRRRPLPEVAGMRLQEELQVACGPAGTSRRKKHSVPQQRRRHIYRCVGKSGMLKTRSGPMDWASLAADLDNDGWPDIYVAMIQHAADPYHQPTKTARSRTWPSRQV